MYRASEVMEQSKESVKTVGNLIKIVITNSHANNRGDEAAQRSMINSLKILIPNAEFTVLTVSPDGLQLQENVRILQTFSASKKTGPFIILWTVFRSLGIRLPTFNKGHKIFEALEEMANADVIISAPGGPYFGDLYASHEIQEHLLHIYLCKILRKPLMIYGPSMGPFKKRWRNIIRKYILNKVEIITLRDHISMKYLDNLNLTKPLVYLTTDSAFQDIIDINIDEVKGILLKEKIIAAQNKDINKKILIGITPAGAEWNCRNSENPHKEQARYNKIIAKTIDYLIDKFDATIVFFPQLYGNSDDMPLINEIIKMVDKKNAVKVLSKRWNSEIQQAIISQMDLVIGNRYHSVIFALKGKIPTVCLAYEHKSVGIMHMVGLDKFVININDLTYENLIVTIDQAWNQREKIRKGLNSQMEIVRKRSLVNSMLATGLINSEILHTITRDELKIEIDKLMQEIEQENLSIDKLGGVQ